MKFFFVIISLLVVLSSGVFAQNETIHNKEYLEKYVDVGWLTADASGFVLLLMGMILKFPVQIMFLVAFVRFCGIIAEMRSKR